MRHTKIWWANQLFWTMIGFAIFLILNAAGVFGLKEAGVFALGAVVVAYMIFDTFRDVRHFKP